MAYRMQVCGKTCCNCIALGRMPHSGSYLRSLQDTAALIDQQECISRAVITPLVADSAWTDRFADLPPMTLPTKPVLVVAPHPDDETLGAGALIWSLRSAGVPVTVVAATDGENAYEISASARRELATIREGEQADALRELGVSSSEIRRLRLVDSGLMGCVERLIDRLMEIVTYDTILLAPWIGDFHPDHEACAQAATVVAKAKSAPLISYFFWTWHRGEPSLLNGCSLQRFNPEPAAREAKARALAKHRSQLDWPDSKPILPGRLLAPARWPFEIFMEEAHA